MPNPSPDFAPQPPEEPPAPDTNPWDSWQSAGIDPSYDPHQARQALGFWDALSNRDQRDYAVEQLVRNELPEGMNWREAREILRQQAQPEDPWAALSGEPEYEEQPYQQPPGLDPNALKAAMEAEMDRRFAERDQRRERERAQQAFEAEFTREVERVAGKYDFEDVEVTALAAHANMLRQSNPYEPTQKIMDRAGAEIMDRINRRLQALSTRQQETAGAPPLPGGPIPSDQQVPQNAEEAREAMRRHFTG